MSNIQTKILCKVCRANYVKDGRTTCSDWCFKKAREISASLGNGISGKKESDWIDIKARDSKWPDIKYQFEDDKREATREVRVVKLRSPDTNRFSLNGSVMSSIYQSTRER